MKNIFIGVIAVVLILISCTTEEKPKIWQLVNTIEVKGVNPIGLAKTNEGIWLSDGDHNRVVRIDAQGGIVQSIDSLDRPMHIDAQNGIIAIAQYGKDEVTTFLSNRNRGIGNGFRNSTVDLEGNKLDAPAGVSFVKKEMAIADFYNHRILFGDCVRDWISIGVEGKGEGEFYYPTDVQITEDKIWVADAYNNRVQVFDKKGNFLKVIGADQKMNAATGIYVTENRVFVTDFENNRVLVFNHEGVLEQEISENIEKPTDLMVIDSRLHVINYRNGMINIFELKVKSEKNE